MEGSQMNQSQQIENAVDAYVEGIDVPRYDSEAVYARRSAAPRRVPFRLAAAAIAACALVAILIVGSPIVLAQVERMLHASETVDGQTVPVAVNSVSLDQARHDMPFAVIAPAGIPAKMSERIDEVNPSSSRLDSRLLFRFGDGTNRPPLTIEESRAHVITQGQTMLWIGDDAPPALPPMPQTGPARDRVYTASRNGNIPQSAEVHTMSWMVRGTRINLISPPGLLSEAQLAMIRRAMSR
jgi:hypothetical protein